MLNCLLIFIYVTCRFFVIANSIVCVYLVLSLPLSIVQIIWTGAVKSRITLVIFDTVISNKSEAKVA